MSMRDFLRRMLQREEVRADTPVLPVPDEASASDTPEPDIASMVDEYASQFARALAVRGWPMPKPITLDAGQTLLSAGPEVQVGAALEIVMRMSSDSDYRWPANTGSVSIRHEAVKVLLNQLLSRRLPFDRPMIERLVDCAKKTTTRELPWGRLITIIEREVEQNGLTEPMKLGLSVARATLYKDSWTNTKALVARIDLLVNRERSEILDTLDTGEAWTDALIQEVAKIAPATRAKVLNFLNHCSRATSTRPSQRWQRSASEQITSISVEVLRPVINAVVDRVGQPGTPEKCRSGGWEYEMHATQVHASHSDLLRALVWCTALIPDGDLIGLLGRVGEVCYQKIPGVGPRAPKIGNACVWALSQIDDKAAVAQLSRLKTRVKIPSSRKEIEKALARAAARLGITIDELEESSVPTFGLTGVGIRRESIGDFTAELRTVGTSGTELTWLKPDGKSQKSVPKSVKDEHGDALKQLKRSAKEIQKFLPAQRDRLERLLLSERSWDVATWRTQMLDHPLVGTLARRLIWEFTPRDGGSPMVGAWLDDRIIDVNDAPLADLANDSRVALWHPIGAEPARVVAWRDWLTRHEIQQPFKQAHREVYILTDAERNTRTYSNRFAAHVVRQHQLNALCQQRGWKYSLMGAWDCDFRPELTLPQWGLRAEFWVEPLDGGETHLSEVGIFLYVATDQVRFYEASERDPLPLDRVPPRVFSEVMRDVDLFVGVASIGNNPQWADGGPDGRFRDYWEKFSFGDLSATAETRKTVLERLIPRLKIAARCTFSDRFLVVRGDHRTYKIHLGSGNILMEPNDQYLCIVPDSSAARKADGVLLPFEGDRTLSIILSKAILLADDTKIKDPSILHQIQQVARV